MPTTRSLRSSTPSIDYVEQDDDEFSLAKPLVLSDLYTPDKTPSTNSKKRKTSTSVKKEVSKVFECDLNLPAEGGLELEAKLFLLSKLDLKGGPTKASTYKCRYLSQICRENPLILGSIGSLRRNRTRWLVDRWKRDTDFDTTRSNLMLLANSCDLQPLPSSQAPTKSKPAAAKKEPQLTSPPKIVNKKSTAMFSPNRSKSE